LQEIIVNILIEKLLILECDMAQDKGQRVEGEGVWRVYLSELYNFNLVETKNPGINRGCLRKCFELVYDLC